MTLSTCSPHPAQVIFPHTLQRTALHMNFSLIGSTEQVDYTPGGLACLGGSGLATEQSREEPAGGGSLFVTLELLCTRDAPHDLVHMLAAARPCRLATNSARDRPAHLVFPFDVDALLDKLYPRGYIIRKETRMKTAVAGGVTGARSLAGDGWPLSSSIPTTDCPAPVTGLAGFTRP